MAMIRMTMESSKLGEAPASLFSKVEDAPVTAADTKQQSRETHEVFGN